ncbi:MAG: hypothetical protein Fur0032_03320 [Terrimicrobiaceae bacterium]
MKIIIPAIAAAILGTLPLQAGNEGHGHSHAKREAGPNGGRILTAVEPHAEFLVLPDRKIQITFLGEDGKPVAAEGRLVTVTMGERSAPVKMNFTPAGPSLISDLAVPMGNHFPVVVQFRPTPDAKPVVEKFMLDMSVCPGCRLAEYACICERSH